MARHAVDIAFAELLAQLVIVVIDLDGAAAHDVHETVFRRKAAAAAQVADLDVGGQLVEQLVAEIDERIALFEKLSDLEQFDFHPGFPPCLCR